MPTAQHHTFLVHLVWEHSNRFGCNRKSYTKEILWTCTLKNNHQNIWTFVDVDVFVLRRFLALWAHDRLHFKSTVLRKRWWLIGQKKRRSSFRWDGAINTKIQHNSQIVRDSHVCATEYTDSCHFLTHFFRFDHLPVCWCCFCLYVSCFFICKWDALYYAPFSG